MELLRHMFINLRDGTDYQVSTIWQSINPIMETPLYKLTKSVKQYGICLFIHALIPMAFWLNTIEVKVWCEMHSTGNCGIQLVRWFSARLQYLHCVSNGDTAVLHKAIELIMNPYMSWSREVKGLMLFVCIHLCNAFIDKRSTEIDLIRISTILFYSQDISLE